MRNMKEKQAQVLVSKKYKGYDRVGSWYIANWFFCCFSALNAIAIVIFQLFLIVLFGYKESVLNLVIVTFKYDLIDE